MLFTWLLENVTVGESVTTGAWGKWGGGEGGGCYSWVKCNSWGKCYGGVRLKVDFKRVTWDR